MVHENEPARAGADPGDAEVGVILTHGRGATARSILAMAQEFPREDAAYAAPQATNNTWYPHSFLEPVEKNEPGRTDGLAAIDRLVSEFVEAGIPRERILLVGFSQGGCLTTEYAARNPAEYGGVAALSGGLIGDDLGGYEGDMENTEVFLGCSDVDPHIPVERVNDTEEIFESLNATVEKRLYEGMGHGVNEDELDYLRGTVTDL